MSNKYHLLNLIKTVSNEKNIRLKVADEAGRLSLPGVKGDHGAK